MCACNLPTMWRYFIYMLALKCPISESLVMKITAIHALHTDYSATFGNPILLIRVSSL